ncbi:IclR helix-turn-helix domain-containing protein [Granulicella rosea]|uniref:IclR helix-turn-helix domain-containing protein n=1 Tax=Granulicella rosea TaxID=474952 RepID=A0A239J0N6_9BACT|nr:helix-turn-helix domain-containing protein [Granulicella rosea]SNS99616.1 IclR helix-turn-helix domain-containing protein [Granulicella rosea]
MIRKLPLDIAVTPESDHTLVQASRTLSARRRRPDVDRSYLVPTLSKAIAIIRLLEASAERLNVNQISERSGVPKSTTYRILRTLSAHGYLPRGADGLYFFDESS